MSAAGAPKANESGEVVIIVKAEVADHGRMGDAWRVIARSISASFVKTAEWSAALHHAWTSALHNSVQPASER